MAPLNNFTNNQFDRPLYPESIFSSFKMLYTGEMGSFSTQEGEVKIFAGTQPLQFWGSLIFKLSLGSFIFYALFPKIKK